MSKTLLQPATMSQATLFELLGQQKAKDAIAAGWIKARTMKCNENGKASQITYSVEDFRRVEERLLAGEYPGQS